MRHARHSKIRRAAYNRTAIVSKRLSVLDSNNKPNEIPLLARPGKKLNRTQLGKLRKLVKRASQRPLKRAGQVGFETDRSESKLNVRMLRPVTPIKHYEVP
jgi:hypothetical protein